MRSPWSASGAAGGRLSSDCPKSSADGNVIVGWLVWAITCTAVSTSFAVVGTV